MKLLTRYFAFAFVVFLLAASGFGQRKERLIDTWQPTHYDIAIAFDNSLSTIKATTRVDIVVRQNNVRTIDLDFGSMPVSSVIVDGKDAKFGQHDEKLDVELPLPAQKGQRLSITVNYSGTPKDGLILTKDRDGNPSAIGDNWPDRVHHWIPSFDHPSAKASVRFSVTAPKDVVVVANGVQTALIATKSKETKTWIFNEERPVSPYNMVVAVGHFATATISGKNRIPVTYYVPMSEGKFAEKGFSAAVPSVATFSNLVAPYPYKKLALIVGATRFGGMENANTIVFSPNYFGNFLTAPKRSKRFGIPAGMVSVDAHEIAHQWFGDSVTESTWADLWLSEGFATYFAGLFFERVEGRAAFDEYMRDQAKSYFEYEKKRRAPIHDTQTEKLFDLLNANNYEKGACVLHMLRRMLDDRAFFAGIRNYYAAHKDSTATTEDLRASLERSSGKDLRAFFDRWIYKAGHPVYQVKWHSAGSGIVGLTLSQLQPDDAFLQPVVVEMVSAKGRLRFVVQPKVKETTVKVKGQPPTKVIIDPDEFILKEIAK
jgi:aminopeptidase N